MRRRLAVDLFEMFPDLPRPRRGSNDGFLIKFQRQVEATRARARANIVKQRSRSRVVQATISARRRR
jgi:hypothetical protein